MSYEPYDHEESNAMIMAIIVLVIFILCALIIASPLPAQTIADESAILIRAENFTGDTVTLELHIPPRTYLVITKVPPGSQIVKVVPSANVPAGVVAFTVSASTPGHPREDSQLYPRVLDRLTVLTFTLGDPPEVPEPTNAHGGA